MTWRHAHLELLEGLCHIRLVLCRELGVRLPQGLAQLRGQPHILLEIRGDLPLAICLRLEAIISSPDRLHKNKSTEEHVFSISVV